MKIANRGRGRKGQEEERRRMKGRVVIGKQREREENEIREGGTEGVGKKNSN